MNYTAQYIPECLLGMKEESYQIENWTEQCKEQRPVSPCKIVYSSLIDQTLRRGYMDSFTEEYPLWIP